MYLFPVISRNLFSLFHSDHSSTSHLVYFLKVDPNCCTLLSFYFSDGLSAAGFNSGAVADKFYVLIVSNININTYVTTQTTICSKELCLLFQFGMITCLAKELLPPIQLVSRDYSYRMILRSSCDGYPMD